jgi:pimeloyl-ACP methyl ester carboxylesterase
MPFLTRDGTRLFYTDSGSGDPPLLFVHGWCCDSSYWRAQAPAFRRTHRIVTTDLRGHGRSSKPEQEYTMDGFCQDLEWLMDELDLRKPVVIGHSMGGLIALLLARRKKRALGGLVMVDASLHVAMSQPAIDGLLQGIASPAYRAAAQLLIESFFRPTSPKAVRAELTERMLRTPQHVLAPALRSLAAEMRPPPLELGIPSLFIDAGRTFDELKLIEATVPGIEIGRTVGAGHFNMIEAADQVNGMLRMFLDHHPVGAGLQTRTRTAK